MAIKVGKQNNMRGWRPRAAAIADPPQAAVRSRDIGPQDIALMDQAARGENAPAGGTAVSRLDGSAEERAAPHYYLEAVVIAAIMAASYLDSAFHIFG